MTISLTNTGRRFENLFTTDAGVPFMGTLIPVDEGAIYANDFASIRHLVRLRADSQVGSGSIFIMPNGPRYLLGDHDTAMVANDSLYRTHVLFQLNKQVKWSREVGTTDTLTGLAKGAGPQDLGTFWALLEQYGREQTDLTLRIKQESLRLVCNKELQLGDRVDAYVVRRVVKTLGVTVAEVQ